MALERFKVSVGRDVAFQSSVVEDHLALESLLEIYFTALDQDTTKVFTESDVEQERRG